MISGESRTKAWLSSLIDKKQNPEIVEKMVMALILAESLKRTGLSFTFNGRTSLSLLTKSLDRFSIDVDIIVDRHVEISPFLTNAAALGGFTGVEEQT